MKGEKLFFSSISFHQLEFWVTGSDSKWLWASAATALISAASMWQQPDFNCSGARRGHTSWKLSCACGLMAIILEMVATSYSLCKTLQCLLPFSFSFPFSFYLSLFPSHILILPLPPISLWSAPCIKILMFKILGVLSVLMCRHGLM